MEFKYVELDKKKLEILPNFENKIEPENTFTIPAVRGIFSPHGTGELA